MAFTIAKILRMQAPFFKIFACGGLSQQCDLETLKRLGIDRVWNLAKADFVFLAEAEADFKAEFKFAEKKLYFYFFRFFLKL